MGNVLQWRAWPGLIGVAVLALGLLVACGGGGGSSFSGVGSGGTGASFTSGAVTGFGSVIVGGVHYDETNARIVDDEGSVRSATDLRLGMVTDIDSTFTGATTAVAQSIKFRSELIGPVSAVDLSGSSLTVLGQRVSILPTTVIDVASLPGGLASVNVNDVVEVYGQFDVATSRLTATRLERHGTVSSYKLRGPIQSIDTAAKTFVIGGQTISYGGVSSVPSSLLEVGRFVRVTLRTDRAGGVWVATALRAGALQLEDRNTVEIEGRISAFTSPSSFSVNGVVVDASAASVSGASLLALGAEVSVKGSSSGGVIRAREVEVEDENATDVERFELSGNITSVDAPPASSFVVRGVTVVYNSGSTQFENGSAAIVLVGAKVEARGVLSSDGTRLQASRIKFDN